MMKPLTNSFLPVIGLSFVIACTGASSGTEPGVAGADLSLESVAATVEGGALTALRSCDEVDEAVRAAASRAMQDLMEENLQQDLETLRRGNCRGWRPWLWLRLDCANCFAAAPPPEVRAPENVSETNNQVAGVDEADFVKNDSRYIYMVTGQELVIIEAWPPEEAHVVSTTSLSGEPKRLFVDGDRLLVFSSVPKPRDELSLWWYQREECTYGYDCEFTGDGRSTRLVVYDIRDRMAPRRVRTINTSASFLSARRIGSAVHTVLYQEPEFIRNLTLYPPVLDDGLCTERSSESAADGWGDAYDVPTPTTADVDRVYAAYKRQEQANIREIEKAPIETLVGTVDDEIADAGDVVPPRRPCERFYDSPLRDGTSFLKLMSFDLQDDSAIETSTVISRAGASYAAGDAYYIAVRQQPRYGYWYEPLRDVREASTIHKFDLMDDGNSYAASGLVKGRVLNQFAMDQNEGYLRIATTTGHVPNPDVHSTLSTLRQEGDELVVVGQVDDIAPTEDIRSVRFLGDRAYVVTFKKTDPLFVFDLSNPERPKTLGELKIPGFSTYLHPLQDGYLMSIGYDADDQEDFAWFSGLMLQMFDVSDPAYPVLAHKEVIGTRGSTSEAATNHLAFNYFAPKHTLALPITVCEGGEGGSYGTDMTFSGVMFYDVDIDTGFSLMGKTSHPYSSSSSFSGNACRNWWTDSNSVVKRTVFMDDFAYSISDVRLKVSDIRDLRDDVAVISLR